MEELKNENAVLQKMVDILDSQPDLVFCVTSEGHITFVSERAKYFIKVEEMSDDDPSHMNQFLTPESMDVFLDAVNQVKQSYLYSSSTGQGASPVSAVRVSIIGIICHICPHRLPHPLCLYYSIIYRRSAF